MKKASSFDPNLIAGAKKAMGALEYSRMIGLGESLLFVLYAAAFGASLPDLPSAFGQEPVFKLVRTVDDPEKYAG